MRSLVQKFKNIQIDWTFVALVAATIATTATVWFSLFFAFARATYSY